MSTWKRALPRWTLVLLVTACDYGGPEEESEWLDEELTDPTEAPEETTEEMTEDGEEGEEGMEETETGATWAFKSGGNVEECIAGWAVGVFVPIRNVNCFCDQLVKPGCSNGMCSAGCGAPETLSCYHGYWLSGVSPIIGCTPSELTKCEQYCASKCTSGCLPE